MFLRNFLTVFKSNSFWVYFKFEIKLRVKKNYLNWYKNSFKATFLIKKKFEDDKFFYRYHRLFKSYVKFTT